MMPEVMPRSLPFLLTLTLLGACSTPPPETPAQDFSTLQFREETIDPELGIGYAVATADINADGKIDIVALSENRVIWYENPSWSAHVVSQEVATPHHVCFAVHDIDGDGDLDLALGADWQARNTEAGGTLDWLEQPDDPTAEWTLHSITSEPTLHRIRWADTDGDGAAELIVAPLHGRGAAGPEWWNGAGARLLVLRPPADPKTPDWPAKVADSSLHMMHNFWVTNFDDDAADELITASYEGVYLLDRGADNEWTRRLLGEGFREGDGDKGAGEVKLGRLANGRRYLATVEPWHANHIVVYEEQADPEAVWPRRVVADQLGAGHALWCGDLDGDGDEELAVGWRGEGEGDFAQPGVAVFDPGDWSYRVVDSGGMATEDLTLADLDADGHPEIIASGRATHNLKIYWPER